MNCIGQNITGRIRRNFKTGLSSLLILCSVCVASQTGDVLYNTGNKFLHSGSQECIFSDFINSSTGIVRNNGTIWFKGSFENNGTFSNETAITPSGLVVFNGTSAQIISGTGSTQFEDVLFNNGLLSSGAFSLEKSISILFSADFTNGIITAMKDNNIFTFEDDASALNQSDQSYIDGFVLKRGDDPFIFPVGDKGYYRFAGISSPAQVSDEFTAKYFNSDPATDGYDRNIHDVSIVDVSDSEYWIIDRTNGFSDVLVTLSWDNNSTSATLPADLNQVSVVRWNGSQWINERSVGYTGNNVAGSVTAQVTDYGIFTIATQRPVGYPVAVDDSTFTYTNQSVDINVLGNDSSTFVPSTLIISIQPASGQAVVVDEGVIQYTPDPLFTGVDSFSYSVCDDNGYCDIAVVIVNVFDDLLIPEVFTPNGDGANDRFVIPGVELLSDNKLTVFNIWGNVVYSAEGYNNEWDGFSNSKFTIGQNQLPEGTYYYIFEYDQNKVKKGFVFLYK